MGQNVINQGALAGAATSVADLFKSAVTGNLAGMVSSGLTAIGDAAQVSQSIPSTIGSNGTLSFNNGFGLMADFLDIADEDLSSRGRPLCKAVQLSGLSGYVQCIDADPEIACTVEEGDSIRAYLNGGFYYE